MILRTAQVTALSWDELWNTWDIVFSLPLLVVLLLIFGKTHHRLFILTALGCIGAVGLIVWTAVAVT